MFPGCFHAAWRNGPQPLGDIDLVPSGPEHLTGSCRRQDRKLTCAGATRDIIISPSLRLTARTPDAVSLRVPVARNYCYVYLDATIEVAMSHGLGALQRQVKEVLDRALDIGSGALPFARLRDFFVIEHGGRPEDGDRLSEAQERSLKRALKGLVDRGDVLIIGGKGGPRDRRRYVTVERLAARAQGAGAAVMWRG
jgi:hypothetical protein